MVSNLWVAIERHSRKAYGPVLAGVLIGGCAVSDESPQQELDLRHVSQAAKDGTPSSDPAPPAVTFAKNASNVDIRRSLVVTEQPMLAGFSFQRVMNQLVAQAGVPGVTAHPPIKGFAQLARLVKAPRHRG